MENKLYRNIIYVFELMLCYRAWLKHKTYWKYEDDATMYNAQNAIKQLLNNMVKLMPRSEGNAWAIPKIHEQLHIAENINIYGAHKNVHTGPQEHNHIENSKKPCKQIQQNKSVLDWQLANRMTKKYIVNSAYQMYETRNDENLHVETINLSIKHLTHLK